MIKKRVIDHIRYRLEWKAGLLKKPSPLEIIDAQLGWDFLYHMANQMSMGYFRYAPLNTQPIGSYDVVAGVKRRMERYEETGNQEFLVDAANMAMMEFHRPTHPAPHFTSEDDGEHEEKVA